MRTRAAQADSTADLIWLCRRLASALHGGVKPMSALEAVATEAPGSLARTIKAMRDHLASGDFMGRGLAQLGLPRYIWEAICSGEARGEHERTLTLLADRLELERSLSPPATPRLQSLSLTFGRLGFLLALHVPMFTALEAAAEAVPDLEVRKGFRLVQEAVRQGAGLAEALASLSGELPPMALDMVRDAEHDGRLSEALPVIADYLLDVAAEKPVRRIHKEVRNA